MPRGNPRRYLKILQAEGISTVFGEEDRAQAQSETSNCSQVAGAGGESQRQVAVVLETVIAAHMAVQ